MAARWIPQGSRVLDIGCGVGGSTRRLSHETGCCVTGIDLSDEYIDAAERLTQLLNMQERVKFHGPVSSHAGGVQREA